MFDDIENEEENKKEKEIILVLLDDELISSTKKIVNDPNLFEQPPYLELNYLFYAINDFRIKYPKESNKKVKKLLDFMEYLFKKEIDKMEKLIRTGNINYDSLWYYATNSSNRWT